MRVPILAVAVLVTVTVLVHATGFTLLLRSLMKSHAEPRTQHWPIAWLLIRVAWWLILIHVAEISLWASFYLGRDACPMPSRPSTFPEPLIRPLAMATSCWRSRGGRSRRWRV